MMLKCHPPVCVPGAGLGRRLRQGGIVGCNKELAWSSCEASGNPLWSDLDWRTTNNPLGYATSTPVKMQRGVSEQSQCMGSTAGTFVIAFLGVSSWTLNNICVYSCGCCGRHHRCFCNPREALPPCPAQCGSCAAFSAMAAIEASFITRWNSYNYDNSSTDGSEQDGMLCLPGDQCKGAWPADYLDRVICTGMAVESDVPYTASDDDNCPSVSRYISGISNWARVPANQDDIRRALHHNIVPITIKAGGDDFMVCAHDIGVECAYAWWCHWHEHVNASGRGFACHRGLSASWQSQQHFCNTQLTAVLGALRAVTPSCSETRDTRERDCLDRPVPVQI